MASTRPLIDERLAGAFGIGACLLFWSASFVLGALRPGYSHVANTVSELGALGTPYAMPSLRR